MENTNIIKNNMGGGGYCSSVFAVKHKNNDVRLKSRSGGMFVAVSDWVLRQGGVVYGCTVADDFKAVHIRAATFGERDRLLGSKYVQSDLKDVFKNVKTDLLKGEMVLFSGTSCQVAGLKGYLGQDYDLLYTVDIVCHGVPSPVIWKDNIDYIQQKHHSDVTKVDFRNKQEFGWADHVETYTLKSGKNINTSAYTEMFYGHYILRPACHQCPYKSQKRVADISLADFWGVNHSFPGFNDNRGVSAVIIGSLKGKQIFDAVRGELTIKESGWEQCTQTAFKKPFSPSDKRGKFWETYYSNGFDECLKIFTNTRKNFILYSLLPQPIYSAIKKVTLRKKL